MQFVQRVGVVCLEQTFDDFVDGLAARFRFELFALFVRDLFVQPDQPIGKRFGSQGPDQGFGLKLANRFRERIVVTPGESADDAVQGCLNVALRRSSIYGRAPVVHDLTLAFTIFGYLDADAPAQLVAHRRRAFEGVANAAHHYAEGRALVDAVPEATFRLTPEQAGAAYRTGWRGLIGA